MIKHIVMFKLIEFDTAEAKEAKLKEIKAVLEGLMNKIEVLREIRVDFNCNPEETWDFLLTTSFDKMEDIGIYASHPLHVAAVKDVIAPVKADRACVDYEVL